MELGPFGHFYLPILTNDRINRRYKRGNDEYIIEYYYEYVV